MTASAEDDATSQNGRKRSHPETDDDETPTTAVTSNATTPSKKRKLNGTKEKESSAAPRTLSAITSAISNVFGYGRPSATAPSNNANGTAAVNKNASANASPARPAIKLKALKGTIWDNEEKPRLQASPVKQKTPKAAKAATPRKKTPKTTPRSKKSTASAQDDDATPRAAIALDESPSKPRSTIRANGHGGAGLGEADEDSADELSTDPAMTPSKAIPGKRLWGGAASPAPKSILTPSKHRNQTPKSVKFDKGANKEVFFDDLPKKGNAKTPSVAPVSEITCGLCNKGHSRTPNQIILCDNCDYAVHQECYGIKEIPEGDWLCKSCSQEDALNIQQEKQQQQQLLPDVTAPTTATTTAETTATTESLDLPNLDTHLRAHQRVLLDRCTGRRRVEIFGLQEARDKAYQLIEQTVVAGEGNSMLLIGARGSGKTNLLEGIVADIAQEHRNDFHVVRLNGFIHTDDKLALKEIWRQLGKEMQVEDDLVNRTNYADTMASLLALLSHPSEILGTDQGVTSQSIVFIIDEFDMFASHPRQTLLYNLFDVAQSRKAPIAVLGCTTRLDVVEMLEKRVKSRFSHRYIYLPLPKTLPAYWQVCRQGLVVDKKDAEKEGIDTSLEGYADFQKYWSQKIDALYQQRHFQDLLQYHYYTSKSAAAFFNEWILPLSSLSVSNLEIQVPIAGPDLDSLTPPDSRIHLLATLSDLDLGLLIAAARLDIVAHTDTVNFAMAYDEYSSLVGRQRVQSSTSGMLAVGGGVRVWSRGVAVIAWEKLISLGLLVPAGIGGSVKASGMGGLEGRMWKVDVVLEEIAPAAKLSAVQAKWCREI